MKYLLILLSSLFSISGFADSSCPTFQAPSEFSLHEKLLSWSTTLDIRDSNSSNLGQVTAKIFSIKTTFILTNAQNQVVAQAEKELFSWGSHIDIFDCHHEKIGAIKEDIMKNLFSFSTTYEILDSHDKTIAQSVKPFHIGDTNIEIGHNGRNAIKLNRPWLSLKDVWQVSVEDPNIVDSRILVMIGAYKTYSDNSRQSKSDNDD